MGGENNEKIQRLKDQEDSIGKYAYTLSTIYLFGFLGIDKVPMIKDIDESLDVFVFGLSIYSYIQIILAAFIIMSTVYVVIRINTFEISEEDVYFKTPLMPYFPIVNLIINFYLMSVLELELWVYFAIWMSIGLFIYFSYGIWNSSE